MDTTTTTLVRQLIGIVQPWDHSSTNDLGPTRNDRTMYVSRDHMMATDDDGGNITTASEAAAQDETAATMSVWHTMIFIIAFFFLILLTLIIKDGICKYFGITCCEGRPMMPHNSQHPLEESEAGLTAEQIKEKRLEKQRLERRLWYSYYLKPYITVLTAAHFDSDDENKEDTNQLQQMEEGTAAIASAASANHDERGSNCKEEDATPADELKEAAEDPYGAMCVIDLNDDSDGTTSPTTDSANTSTDETTNQASTKQDNLMVCKPVGAMMISGEGSEEGPTKWMTIWDSHDTTFRKVEANCSICLLDYEEGDTIVRSGADEEEEYCTHVFHLECMLQWLSHGRKRCPICRRWFVPASRIKEQMKKAHVVTRDSLHHLYDSRTMQDVISLSSGDTDSDMSRSFNTDVDTPDDIDIGRQGPNTNQNNATSATALQQIPTSTSFQSLSALPARTSQNQDDLHSIDPETGYHGLTSLPSPWLLPTQVRV